MSLDFLSLGLFFPFFISYSSITSLLFAVAFLGPLGSMGHNPLYPSQFSAKGSGSLIALCLYKSPPSGMTQHHQKGYYVSASLLSQTATTRVDEQANDGQHLFRNRVLDRDFDEILSGESQMGSKLVEIVVELGVARRSRAWAAAWGLCLLGTGWGLQSMREI